MKTNSIAQSFVLLFMPVLLCGQVSFISPKLSKKWETPSMFKTPESVYYDDHNNVLYVSNINGNPGDKDGNGFISRLSLDGKILDLKWVTGLDAPKGMGIYKDRLFVTDLTVVVEIDIALGKIVKRYPAQGSSFLNDITVSPSGVVYISDSQKGYIYQLSGGTIKKILQGLEKSNGLFYQDGKLLVGTVNSVESVNLKTLRKSTLLPNTGSIDGLESDGNKGYLYSDWAGSVHWGLPGKPAELLLNTTPDKINAADITYIPSKRMLLVPTFFDNRVFAYGLNIMK
jgi:hypothetical protein